VEIATGAVVGPGGLHRASDGGEGGCHDPLAVISPSRIPRYRGSIHALVPQDRRNGIGEGDSHTGHRTTGSANFDGLGQLCDVGAFREKRPGVPLDLVKGPTLLGCYSLRGGPSADSRLNLLGAQRFQGNLQSVVRSEDRMSAPRIGDVLHNVPPFPSNPG
jgi:hypothetical protein